MTDQEKFYAILSKVEDALGIGTDDYNSHLAAMALAAVAASVTRQQSDPWGARADFIGMMDRAAAVQDHNDDVVVKH